MWIGIYIRTPLDRFEISTDSMNIDIGLSRSYDRTGRWSFRIRDHSRILSNHGNITTSYWDSRDAYVKSERGSIRGKYGLNNNLRLETDTGDIEVDIQQQAAHKHNYLDSHPPNVPANLTTITGSGKQVVKLKQGGEALWTDYPYKGNGWFPENGGEFLIASSHSSKAGSISLETGTLWEGGIHAKSTNGSINFTGDDLRFISNPGNGTGGNKPNDVWARKGNGESAMMIETREGDVLLRANDVWS